jgi:hypothetical protein
MRAEPAQPVQTFCAVGGEPLSEKKFWEKKFAYQRA